MGARQGYSVLNGAVIVLLCLFGAVPLVLRVVPIEATLGILLWIGIIISAQAFQEVPRAHAPAVVLGLVPGLAAWAVVLIETTLRVAGSNLADAAQKFGPELYVRGAVALSQGFLLTSMVLAAFLVFVIEKKMLLAAAWAIVASALSMIGLIHAYDLTPQGVANHLGLRAAPAFAMGYALAALLCVALHFYQGRPHVQEPPDRAG